VFDADTTWFLFDWYKLDAAVLSSTLPVCHWSPRNWSCQVPAESTGSMVLHDFQGTRQLPPHDAPRGVNFDFNKQRYELSMSVLVKRRT